MHVSFGAPLAVLAFQVGPRIDIVELVTLGAGGADAGVPIHQVRQQSPQQAIVVQPKEVLIKVAVGHKNLLLVRVMGQERHACRRTGDVFQRVDQGQDLDRHLSLRHFIPSYPRDRKVWGGVIEYFAGWPPYILIEEVGDALQNPTRPREVVECRVAEIQAGAGLEDWVLYLPLYTVASVLRIEIKSA